MQFKFTILLLILPLLATANDNTTIPTFPSAPLNPPVLPQPDPNASMPFVPMPGLIESPAPTLPLEPVAPIIEPPVVAPVTSGDFHAVSAEIQIKAEIITAEKGSINAVWQLGGSDTTQRGDTVVWGYFHASEQDVTWGSAQNPDLFVKIWFDASGRIDVNYFHVSVPDIIVHSLHQQPNSSPNMVVTTASLNQRYVRHYLWSNELWQVDLQKLTEVVKYGDYTAGFRGLINPHARPKAIINTVELGAIEASEHIGGQAFTARGDFVMWGYFYADPARLTWGSKDNPDLFYKIWQDANSRRIDTNFFHVSVPEIFASSSIFYVDESVSTTDFDVVTFRESLTTTTDRYVRHEYQPMR